LEKLRLAAALRVEDILLVLKAVSIRVNVNLTSVSKINDEMFHGGVVEWPNAEDEP
jgi:hypothetical protein